MSKNHPNCWPSGDVLEPLPRRRMETIIAMETPNISFTTHSTPTLGLVKGRPHMAANAS